MAFAAAGKSLLDTVPTILSPAPAAKISSVMCGARVMARAAGALVCAASAARAGLPYAGPACAGSGTREVAQAPAAKQHAEDRKRVVQGKSVSVRVDLRGRRRSKKKNNQNIRQ